jgi:nucleoid-associated protein YejK
LKFNKATAVELDYPAYVKMYINAATKQVAIKPCKENAKNAVAFSKDKSKQTYAIVVKVPALLTAMKKLVDMEGTGTAVSFNGELFPNERVIIYDVTQGQPAKTRRRRKKKDLSTEGADNKEDSKSEQGNE